MDWQNYWALEPSLSSLCKFYWGQVSFFFLSFWVSWTKYQLVNGVDVNDLPPPLPIQNYWPSARIWNQCELQFQSLSSWQLVMFVCLGLYLCIYRSAVPEIYKGLVNPFCFSSRSVSHLFCFKHIDKALLTFGKAEKRKWGGRKRGFGMTRQGGAGCARQGRGSKCWGTGTRAMTEHVIRIVDSI